MAVTFRKNYFSLFRIKISKNSNFFEAGTSAQYQHFQKSYMLEKANFSEKQYSALHYFFWTAAFLERLLFQKTILFIAAAFSELLFYNIPFQRSYYFPAILSFHKLQFLFICQQLSEQFFLVYLSFLKVASQMVKESQLAKQSTDCGTANL